MAGSDAKRPGICRDASVGTHQGDGASRAGERDVCVGYDLESGKEVDWVARLRARLRQEGVLTCRFLRMRYKHLLVVFRVRSIKARELGNLIRTGAWAGIAWWRSWAAASSAPIATSTTSSAATASSAGTGTAASSRSAAAAGRSGVYGRRRRSHGPVPVEVDDSETMLRATG